MKQLAANNQSLVVKSSEIRRQSLILGREMTQNTRVSVVTSRNIHNINRLTQMSVGKQLGHESSGVRKPSGGDESFEVNKGPILTELGRLVSKADPISVIPLYLSFAPYILFQTFAGDGHMIFCGLWYASIMGMILQISRSKLEYHVGGMSLCFIGLCKMFEHNSAGSIRLTCKCDNGVIFRKHSTSSRRSSCQCGYGYLPNSDGTSCTWAISFNAPREQEITFIISILLICMSAFMLQQHVREYAFNLLDRQYAVMNLSDQNANLQQQLKQMRNDDNLDLDSPITKVIKVIREIQIKGDLEADVMESLDYVILLLSSNQLFMPNLNVTKEAMDTDVNKWLNAMVNNQETARPKMGSTANLLDQQPHLLAPVGLDQMKPMSFGTSEANVIEVLENIDTWEFDIFELARVTGGRPLYHLGMALFELYNFQSAFNVDESVMRAFLQKIESSYRPNSYHNSTHAADVMHSMHYFLTVLGLNELVTSEDAFAGIIAGAMHDVDHPGFNNAFMIATSSPTAIRYNDTAVLEHYHASTGFEIMLNEPGCNVLGGLPPERYKSLRASIISMILATDMTGHFEYIAKFKNKMNGAGLEISDPKDRQLCMDIAIKCGDINNAAKSQSLCTQWAMNIMEEFFKQGDAERKRGLPISMFMDRQTTVISKCQVGFIDYIVLPLYEVWDQYMNDDSKFPALENLRANRDYWKR
nr:High affinity cAMP-specific 3',5'-cyclic phosphodiesterase 7A [Polyrhizophydium stewartii]